MGAMKELFTNLQQEFAEYKFIKDGCPEGDAKKEDWESMVKSFFDGDSAAALEEFQVWCGGELPARSQDDLCVPDTADNHREHEEDLDDLQEQKEAREEDLRWENRDRMSDAESLGLEDERK